MDGAAQRTLKGQVVAEQLRRLAGIERDVDVMAVPGDSDGLGWRTRVEFAVDAAGRAGLRRHRSHEVVPIVECPIADPRVLASGVLDTLWPVSYTHLDVYKRQVLIRRPTQAVDTGT